MLRQIGTSFSFVSLLMRSRERSAAMSIIKTAIASTLSTALVASQISLATAAPLPTNVVTMKSIAAAAGPTQVYWRGGWGGWGWGAGAGLLSGAIIGGAIASGGYGYYGAPYYYGYPAYPYYGYYAPRSVYYGYGAYYGHGSYGYYGYPRYRQGDYYRYW
jgi:hypothetical protein